MSLKTEETTRSLGDSINVATRSVHTQLNKLIIARLPLAIPPQAKGPSNYISGLLHITPIYDTFESLWQDILQSPAATESDDISQGHSCEACKPSSAVHHAPNTIDAPHAASVCTRIHSLLQHLHTTDLERTSSLKRDISAMTGWSSELLEEHLASAEDSPFLSAFIEHIERSVRDQPHVLLAYAWVLYMALFSGGRFIRAALARLAPEFWITNLVSPDSSKPEDGAAASSPPLRFFTFDAPNEGDEIKLAFKKRLAQSEYLLTGQEWNEVVAEAQRIFEFMIKIVNELDGVCRTDAETKQSRSDQGIMWRMSRLLGMRTRDSVVVTRERKAWANRSSRQQDWQEGEPEDADEDEDEDEDAQVMDLSRLLDKDEDGDVESAVPCWHGDYDSSNKHLTFIDAVGRAAPGDGSAS